MIKLNISGGRFMKRGQTGIGLVLLGVVAIIAVIGLVLLFTRASTSGAAVHYGGYGDSLAGVGQSYSWDRSQRGITRQYEVPTSVGPQIQSPSPGTLRSKYQVASVLFPAFLIQATTPGSVAGLEDMYGVCINDLVFNGHMTTHQFGGFVQGNWAGRAQATGQYPGSSSAYTRLPIAYPQGMRDSVPVIGRTGGDVFVWANPGGQGDGTFTQEEVNDLIVGKVASLVRANAIGQGSRNSWGFVDVTNSEGETRQIAACRQGEWEWPFPQ